MIEVKIGDKIRSGREKKKMSQSQLADALGITRQAVGKWERDESLPDLNMLGQIGRVIGTNDLNYFLGSQVKLCSCDKRCHCMD
jgi:transcriptional regulator with XRE-family HTH domain